MIMLIFLLMPKSNRMWKGNFLLTNLLRRNRKHNQLRNLEIQAVVDVVEVMVAMLVDMEKRQVQVLLQVL